MGLVFLRGTSPSFTPSAWLVELFPARSVSQFERGKPMKPNSPRSLWASLLALMLLPISASAQGAYPPTVLTGGTAGSFHYQIGEGSFPDAGDNAGDATPTDPATAQGPVRLARFSYVHGSGITWRPSQTAEWSPAGINLPLRQGAQVWVTNGGRAEVQFDDGSLLRLGSGALVTLQTLYSDTDGEYTEIQMTEGLASLELRHATSIFQVDTPFASVKAAGPAKVRVGVNDNVEVAVRDGSAAVEGAGQKIVLRAGDYLNIPDADAAYQAAALPDADSWDRWNDSRDAQLADADSDQYLPANIALVSGDLNDSGSWRDDPRYGHVWCPRVDDADWRPYQHGHWVWVDPFGWTWVSSEAWGWAPYHYGTWVDESYGWAWVPGPAHQYWCPAVVHFSEYNGAVAWCPLAPAEVHYPPAHRLGFRSGGWSPNFSIGGCAVYYPANDRYCEPRPFNNVVVNKTVYVNNVTNVYNINRTTINRNVHETNYHFVPGNAQTAGVTTASEEAFGGRGEYQPAPRVATAYFTQGRGTGAPERGAAPVAGPIGVRPTAEAYTPSRRFLPATRPDSAFEQRPMFRAPLPRRVALVAPPLSHPAPRTYANGDASAFGRPQGDYPRPFRGTQANTGGFNAQGQPGGQTAQPFSDADRRRQAAQDARQSLGETPTGDTGRARPSRTPAFDNVPSDRPNPVDNIPRPFRGTSAGQDTGPLRVAPTGTTRRRPQTSRSQRGHSARHSLRPGKDELVRPD